MSRIEYDVDITSVVTLMRVVDGVLAPLAKGVRP